MNENPIITNEQEKIDSETVFNSLSAFISSLMYGDATESTQLSQVDTLFKNNRWYMISNMRQILSQIYCEHGLVQTLIDQPVEDAFRKGYKIKTKQMSEDEIEELDLKVKESGLNEVITQAFKWNRLFGGAGILIITGQDPNTPLEKLNVGDPLSFRALDMWELFYSKQNTSDTMLPEGTFGLDTNNPDFRFNYYGKQIHPSRVITLKGKEPPSFIRPRLRGWGMSELEKLVRSMNQFLKNQELIFELMDEAKIDVYKIQKFNSSLMTKGGTDRVTAQVQQSNILKNYQNAIVMDKDDEYEQKSMAFSGLSEMLREIRIGLATDLKMPMTKLFGISSAGFNSGEDDIENYNSMVEGEIRCKANPVVIECLKLICQTLFGDEPEKIEIEFPSLRVLSSVDEQRVKNDTTSRVVQLFSSGLITAEEAKEAINKDDLLPNKIEVNDEVYQTKTDIETTQQKTGFFNSLRKKMNR